MLRFCKRKMVLLPLIYFFLILQISRCQDEQYILKTQKCKIPKIEPFNDDIKTIIKPSSYIPCNTTELLSNITKNGKNFELHIRQDLISEYTNNSITCCYSSITRNGSSDFPDVGISISPCEYFEEKVVLQEKTVKVTCQEILDENNTLSTIYENVHTTLKLNPHMKKKLKKMKKGSKPFSVLFVVVDSISRLNFIRQMPETYNYLLSKHFIEMKGYTKIGDNTFPNFMALLTGFTPYQSYKKCRPTLKDALDQCPMIWYSYRQNGYITAYAEDNTPIMTFNFLKKGFTNPPTDFYFKPYFEGSETLPIRIRNKMPFCTGPESAGERVLNLAKDFAISFQNHPTFGIFWMNTFSHDEINAPRSMDLKMREFFGDLDQSKVLEDSFVIFLSDHGIRSGQIRETPSGWFEERMPANFISVPKKFKEEFPDRYKNLKENSGKLTNTFDLYMTLQDILSISRRSYKATKSQGCQDCVSLFEKISERTCKQAGITPEWCTCFGHFTPMNETEAENITILAYEKAKIKIEELCKNISQPEFVSGSVSEMDNEGKQNLFLVFRIEKITILSTIMFEDVVTDKSRFFFKYINLWEMTKDCDKTD